MKWAAKAASPLFPTPILLTFLRLLSSSLELFLTRQAAAAKKKRRGFPGILQFLVLVLLAPTHNKRHTFEPKSSIFMFFIHDPLLATFSMKVVIFLGFVTRH
jgi:hypothetical protein